MLHHESHVPAHVALRITLVANPQRKSSSFLVTILKKSAKSPPPLQQYQWLRPTKWPRRAKITEKKLEVGLVPRGLPLACDVLHFGVVIGLDNWLVGFFILIQKKQVFSLKKPFSRVAKTSGND